MSRLWFDANREQLCVYVLILCVQQQRVTPHARARYVQGNKNLFDLHPNNFLTKKRGPESNFFLKKNKSP